MNLALVVEALILASSRPLSVEQILVLLGEDFPDLARETLRDALADIASAYQGRALELCEVAGGYRFQVCREYAHWVHRLSDERPQKYSRALLETLAIIAYRQPITRADIEDIRGVAVNSQIVKTLQEREWIRVVGHREVPGRPALLATTRQFLDYFGLRALDELPPLADLRDLDEVGRILDAGLRDATPPDAAADQAGGELPADELVVKPARSDRLH